MLRNSLYLKNYIKKEALNINDKLYEALFLKTQFFLQVGFALN